MDPRPHSPAEAADSRAVGEDLERIDPSRRRLVRSGLAGSVVLGSLVSKPVLGAEYICTVSGFASGNMSAHLTQVDCAVGHPPSYWAASAQTWPASIGGVSITKGSLPNNACNGTNKGTTFNALTDASAYFYAVVSNSCTVGTTDTGAGAATMLSVVATTTADNGDDFHLGRATVASLLNTPIAGYPISAARIIEMFTAVFDGNGGPGGTYHVDGANLNLTRAGVIEYFEKLY